MKRYNHLNKLANNTSMCWLDAMHFACIDYAYILNAFGSFQCFDVASQNAYREGRRAMLKGDVDTAYLIFTALKERVTPYAPARCVMAMKKAVWLLERVASDCIE